jgi:5-oxopent-3-ene-1,2,5-tricarboxylate decarboxylase/2-hydroxyhepta-2,4-diene-1,7-dioate isomerase
MGRHKMKIGYFSSNGAGFVGAVLGERVFNLSEAASRSGKPAIADLTSLFREERFDGHLLGDLYNRERDRQECWHFLENLSFPPLLRPGKIICLGLNYAEHAREGKTPVPEEPIYFEKAVTSIIAHDQSVMYLPHLGRIDPEIELAFVIGKRARGVKEAEARDYIAGYTILNDVTARDLQQKDIGNRHPWYRSKSLDTFCPIGPWIVTADEIDPQEALMIKLRVNGEVRQNSSTRYLVFNVPTLICRISELITLELGDIVSTGTPEGIAPVYPGDVMEAEIEKIGILRNPVKRMG